MPETAETAQAGLAPPRVRPCLTVRARADRRVAAAAVAGAAAFDIAAHNGLATVAGTAWVLVLGTALLLTRRVRGRAAAALIGAAALLAVVFAVRSSVWVTAPVAGAIAFLLLLGASLGADGAGLSVTFPGLAARAGRATGHLALAPGMFRPATPGSSAAAVRRAAAVSRGLLLGVPVLILVGALLAAADPIFRSWFSSPVILDHALLLLMGAWGAAGLARAASARRPAPALPAAPALGTVEAAVVLGGLSALYAAFVAAQFVALSGAGHRILVTHGLTYAKYARSGFFELLACAAVTLLVLLGVRACAAPSHPALTALSALTATLTLGVVVVAVRRLGLYEAAYGLTMLRLACLVAAWWIGAVFVIFGLTIPRRGLPRRRFPAAVLISAVLVTAAWALVNPAAVVATVNLRRAATGRSLDVSQLTRLGPDAAPAVVADLGRLPAAEAALVRQAVCGRAAGPGAAAAFNLSRASASAALARACRPAIGERSPRQ